MIIDVHAHAFPHHGTAAGYKDVETHLKMQQALMERLWGRMVSSTLDEKYRLYSDEDVNFRIGKYGRYYWTKHGKDCWIQRYPAIMVEMEWAPEQTIAVMDSVGVDKAVLQAAEYMGKDFCLDYFAECIRKWPDRFIGTVSIDYDIEKTEAHREAELEKLRDAVRNRGMTGVFHGYPRHQDGTDEAFEPYWREISELGAPHFFWTGFEPKQQYLEHLKRVEKVLRRFPDVIGIIGHLGGNVRPPDHPEYTGTPQELLPILRLPNAYFEIGYVLSYENRQLWGDNYEYPFPLHTELVRVVYEEVGASKLLWGTDIPNNYRTCTYLQMLDLVRLHFDFLDDEEKGLVLGGNTARLFNV